MKRRPDWFNIYFAIGVSALCVLLAAGCSAINAGKKAINPKKEQSTMRIYLEGPRGDAMTTGTVLVTREKLPFSVEREAFLTEADISTASVVDNGDGTYALQLAFNEHGTMLLDMYTTSNKGKHLIIFSQFPKPGKPKKPKKKPGATNDDSDLIIRSDAAIAPPDQTLLETSTPAPDKSRESAWLAAILIRQPVSTGLLRFTPDASKAECLRIVRGLRNVIGNKKKNQ
jgi:hypothetical protein